MGNCGTCVNDSTTSSNDDDAGLTLHNYGTIQSFQEAVYGGHLSSHTSKKTKIYNYDGGIINADKKSISILSGEGIELYNYNGATIEADDGNYGVNFKSSSDVTIDNAGTISSSEGYAVGLWLTSTSNLDNSGTISTDKNYGVHCLACVNLTLTNSGTISAGEQRGVYLPEATGTNTITNSGTISSVGAGAVDIREATGVTLVNLGTLSAGGNPVDAAGAVAPTIKNYGTITSLASKTSGIGINLTQQDADNLGSGATITNSGTIEALGTNADGIKIGDGQGEYNDVTITNSGTIKGLDNSIWIDGSDTTGTNIITKGEATYTGEIEMESAAATMTLDCSITKDMDIEIHGKTNMTVTSNLCGNDTYEILDSSKNADADNSETDGYLRILGEDLEVDDENAKYRSENVLTKFRGLFDAANYINWHAPEDKFFKIFHSSQKREGTYKGSMSGVVGQLSPFILGDIRNNIFLGYTRQDGDFDNGEFLGGDNYALGLKSVYENNGFKASFTPMIGLNDLTITDFDTDTLTKINTNLLSEFAGFNTKFGKEIKTGEDSSLNLSVQSTLGLQRFPDYLAKFSDGDLSVDEAIEQVLGAGFEVRYTEELGKGFIIQPYIGANLNNNLNNSIKITADGENKNVSPAYETTTGYFAGVSFTKEAKDINFDLDLMYGNEDGLINQIAAVSLTKSFGQSEKAIPKTNTTKDIRIASTMSNQDLLEFGELKELNNKLKIENQRLKTENEKLKMLSAKVLEENNASKQLIVELLKENEKIKLEKEIFKNKILENENKELLKEIEKGVSKNEVNRFALLLFVTILILIAYGLASVTISILKVSFKK